MKKLLMTAALTFMVMAPLFHSCKVKTSESLPSEETSVAPEPDDTVIDTPKTVIKPRVKDIASRSFQGEVDYDSHFTGNRLRVDLTFCGDRDHQSVYLKGLHREKTWSGSPSSLIDKFGYGQYYVEVFSKDSLLYSKGFCTLFEEWRTTEEAKTRQISSDQSVWIPFPKHPVRMVVYSRIRKTGKFESLFELDIDPSDRHISNSAKYDFEVRSLQYKGDPSHKVDIVIAGDGYTEGERSTLRADAMTITEHLMSMQPYASRRNDFNVWLVESISGESGTDIPQEGVWKNTLMDSMFDTFYIDRYLTVMDQTKIAEVVAPAPADAIIVLVNDSKYGGSGMYGSYAMTSAHNRQSLKVVAHEFGHSFAGLADEYYNSGNEFEEFYPLNVEPWEPNITTNVDFASKWADMVEEGTPMPTPNDSTYVGTVGMFEGAGYMTKGCYRPYFDCYMLSNSAPAFCPVCQRAIERMIDFYTK